MALAIPKKVTIFVYNNFLHDTRVLKEARELVGNGYDVTVMAVLDEKTKPSEILNGIKIIRVPKNPIQYKILRVIRRTFRFFEKVLINLGNFRFATIIFIFFPPLFYIVKKLKEKQEADQGDEEKREKENFLSKFFKGASNIVYESIKKFLMIFHKPFSFFDYYMRSNRIVAAHPADIYHANDLNTLPVAWWAARRNGAKLLYDSHELYTERNTLKPANRTAKFLLKKMEAFLIRRTHAVITVNESIAQELALRYHIPVPTVVMNIPSKTNTLTNGNKTLLRKALGIAELHHFLLLYSGLITFNRGLEKVIESLSYLPDCYLVLMGYGTEKYKKQLQELALSRGLETHLLFYGPVPSDEVTVYAAGADLGIAPIENSCLSYYYCSPNKIFEYISAGLAVVASDFPEMKKVIYQHNIGCTFNPDSPPDIARAIKYVIEDAERWNRMKQNTLNAARSYTWENESKKLLSLYKTLN